MSADAAEEGVSVPDDKTRFECDLDFVNFLSNEKYIYFLLEQGYFEDEAFYEYLRYLYYFREPVYIRFVQNPRSLFYLQHLYNKDFVEQLDYIGFNNFQSDQDQFESVLKYFQVLGTYFYYQNYEIVNTTFQKLDQSRKFKRPYPGEQ